MYHRNCEKLRLSVSVYFYRYLASGDMMSSLKYQFLRGKTTISNIIAETCEVIWSELHEALIPAQLDQDDWVRIADEFASLWNFPQCIGSIDGKHIVIQVFASPVAQ